MLSAAVYARLAPEEQARCVDLGTMQARGMEKDIHVYGVDEEPPATASK